MNLFESSEESDSNDELEEMKSQKSVEDGIGFTATIKPEERVFTQGKEYLETYMKGINKFERLTSQESCWIDQWGAHKSLYPVMSVSLSTEEQTLGTFDLISNTHPFMEKIIATFSYLQHESKNITEALREKFYDPLHFFGENGSLYEEEEELPEGESEVQLARMFGIFKELYELTKRITILSKNILYQLNAIYQKKSPLYKEIFKKVVLTSILDAFGELLEIFIVVDIIVNENKNFNSYLTMFSRMIIMAKQNPQKYGMNDKIVKKIEKESRKYV